jgi:tetratricopeptide (TPR) repeat protein
MKTGGTVAIIATAWGSRFGGINSFSTDMCCALARVLSTHKILCICSNPSKGDLKQAEAADVEILAVAPDNDFDAKSVLSAVVEREFEKNGIEWWIGHDAVTGQIALECAKASSARCAVIMHMSYDDYSYVKHGLDGASAVAARVNIQRELLEAAEVGLAVGPLLLQRIKEIRGENSKSSMLVPGLAGPTAPVQTSDRINGITFGRFDSAEFLTKQAPLVVAAFGRVIREGHKSRNTVLIDSNLNVVGAPNDVGSSLRILGETEARRVWNLKLLEFVEDRNRLRSLLQSCNLCLMLSWHEGFGLSAWEAIGCGIPVILSRNSGVFRLLDEIGGAAVGCVLDVDVRGKGDGNPNEDDVEEVMQAIQTVASDISKALANARSLRHLLRHQFKISWDRTARDLAEALGLAVVKTMLDDSPPIDRRALTEPADVVEGLEAAANNRLLHLAESYYEVGDYAKGLEAIESLKQATTGSRASTIALDVTLLEAEIALRLNQYPRARSLIDKLSNEAAERSDWQRYVRARSIENTILRDQGKYADAAELAEVLLKLVEKENIVSAVEKVHRLAARSLALSGKWDEAVSHGTKALNLAKQARDHNAEGKCALSLGEAYRHGLNQETAVKWYTASRDLSGRAGNTDCFLWAVLGLADSLFLLGDSDGAKDQIERLSNYVTSHVHPLETLHIQLSKLAIAHKMGENTKDALKKVAAEYAVFEITWPQQYVHALIAGDSTQPKRF